MRWSKSLHHLNSLRVSAASRFVSVGGFHMPTERAPMRALELRTFWATLGTEPMSTETAASLRANSFAACAAGLTAGGCLAALLAVADLAPRDSLHRSGCWVATNFPATPSVMLDGGSTTLDPRASSERHGHVNTMCLCRGLRTTRLGGCCGGGNRCCARSSWYFNLTIPFWREI